MENQKNKSAQQVFTEKIEILEHAIDLGIKHASYNKMEIIKLVEILQYLYSVAENMSNKIPIPFNGINETKNETNG